MSTGWWICRENKHKDSFWHDQNYQNKNGITVFKPPYHPDLASAG
jgi:hypothetical protein